jgi:hypothetical protein
MIYTGSCKNQGLISDVQHLHKRTRKQEQEQFSEFEWKMACDMADEQLGSRNSPYEGVSHS